MKRGIRLSCCFLSICVTTLLAGHLCGFGQQAADADYVPVIDRPLHARGRGPAVRIDEGHNNFHTRDGRYAPVASLIEADGYQVGSHRGEVSRDSLANVDVLIVSNALNAVNADGRWELPTASAFSDAEIKAIVDFVESGGGLFLIVDHMPFPGAAAELAARFGVEFTNGYAVELDDRGQEVAPRLFQRSSGGIGDHAITNGRNESEAIHEVATFAGTAFPITGKAVSLIRFGERVVMFMPTVYSQIDETTPKAAISGWSQGVAIEEGKGRVVVFGEAGGLASPQSADNEQLLLNVVRWLSGDL